MQYTRLFEAVKNLKPETDEKLGGLALLLMMAVTSLFSLCVGILIGLGDNRNSSARIDAYQRCVSLMDHGAQWDESEGGWRCKVVTPGAER